MRSGFYPTGLFFALLGGVFATVGGVKLSRELSYRNDGVSVFGVITSKSIESVAANQSSTRYLVGYRFTTAQGAAIDGRDEVDVERWEALRQGDPFEIVYLPASPVTNRTAARTDLPLGAAFTGLGVFVLLVGVVVLFMGVRSARATATVVLLSLGVTACSQRQGPVRGDPKAAGQRFVVGGLSLSVPDGFTEKANERSREPLRNIPGETTEERFVSWEGPGGRSLYLFYWSPFPPGDLGPMVAATKWKARVAGQETEAAETKTFMGLDQRVFVTWFARPDGNGRFMVYARNVSRETFDGILATMSF